MNKHQLFKAAAKVTGLALLIFLILNLVPARLAGAAIGDSHVPLNSLLPSVCETNVAETSNYSMVYQLSIPVDADYNATLPAYSVDNTGTTGNFNRVGYCLELNSNWVWVSMDAFTTVPGRVGVPVSSTGATFQQTVDNMNVASNVPGVVTGTGITTGNIEFWHHCYTAVAVLGLPGNNGSLFDFDDNPGGQGASCYGSMQVHNYGASQTIFGWNRWDQAATDDLGIGNNPGPQPDWTFQSNANSYSTRMLTIYVSSELIVTTEDDVVDANGGSCAGMSLASLPGPDGLVSLREAICAANVNAGADTITFDSSLNGIPITLSLTGTGENANATGDLDITDDLTITGNGAANTIIQAGTNNSNGIDRVFHVVTGDNVALNSLTIRYGRVTGDVGGGIANNGTLNLSTTVVRENRSDSGGGIHNSLGTITATATTLSNNSAFFGAGLMNYQGVVTFNQSTVANNTAGNNGGGVDSDAFGGTATLNVYNSSFSGNSASFAGGAILAYAGGGSTVVNLVNATIHNNNAPSGGLASWSNGGVATFNLANSVIADQAGATADCASLNGGQFLSSNYNLGSDGTCNLVQANDIPNGTANLGPLQDNGGHTQTHALLIGSQAINSGNNTTCAAAPINNVDQRGVARPQNSTCDMGAYELVTAVTPGAAGGLGPGGVGHTDGSTSLELWLRADKSVYADSGCTSQAANGNEVGCWQDQSGNGYSYTQSTVSNQPNYVTSVQNNQPVIRFYGDGNPDFLDSTAVLAAGDDTFTYVASWMGTQTNVDHVIFEQNHTSAVTGRRAAFIATPLSLYGFNGLNNDFHYAAPYTANQYEVSSITLNGNASNNVLVHDSGRQYVGTINMTTQDVGIGGSTIGRYSFASGYDMRGDITEIVVFSDPLNDTDRILVENYLSAMYNVALDTANGAADVYDGDDNGNGDFDLDVAGIGQFGGNQHTQAHAAGMIVMDNSFLNDDGDWLLFGHSTPNNTHSPADLPTTGDWATAPNPLRWARHFYIDVTDGAGTTGGTVDIIFDFSEGNMSPNSCCAPDGDISNYRLLKRTGTTGQFTDIATATAIVGDQVLFQGVDVAQLGSNFTLGSLDSVQSPTAVTLQATNTNTPQQLILPLVILLLVVVTGIIWAVRYARIPTKA